ncbi:hypothetical protein Baya_5868 [Bagarius yarrelli]|uniref:Uncharacterized protein n=1 Tax=Bagarius yarrelli TaxID=175774 RepID=A0A556TXT8_BAGYA|nr:hypothetical protein Baya_5868 [Bagarius yarrelli]
MKCCTCCALLILSVICVQAEVNTDLEVPCITDKSSFSVQNYLLIAMLSLAGSILVCAITHNRVRRFVLPIIPDPKKKMLNFEQMQWWSNFAQTVEDFKVSEVKIYDGEEKMIEITLLSDLDEQPSHTLPTHTVPGKHDFDLATNASTYTIYSSATTEDNIDAQCSATRPGYIII